MKYEHYFRNFAQNVLVESDTMQFGCLSLSADTCDITLWRVCDFYLSHVTVSCKY